MPRPAVLLTAVLIALAATAPAAAQVPRAPKTCGAGVTGFVDGPLRIVGLRWERRGPFGPEWGAEHYACVGRGGRPQSVGSEYGNEGTGSDDTPAYALGGRRYLAALHTTDGEGGPSAHLSVVDLQARRRTAFEGVTCCEGDLSFLVAADGTLAAIEPGEGLWIKRPGRRARYQNSGVPSDLALAGGTVYWREGAQARSVVLDGVAATAESHMLEPMRLPDRDRRCPAVHGRTVAASASVRVLRRAGAARRLGCRAGRRFAAGPAGAPAPRIVGDRWLLVRRPDGVRVLDTRTGETVTRVRGVTAAATLTYDGTLAWTDAAGVLRAARPSAEPVQLSTAATLLAAARRAIYWTEAGAPHVYRPGRSAPPATASATPRVRCGDGTTAFVDGRLRIFGIHYKTSFEEGFEEYACLGRRMRPLLVGGVGADQGVGSAETPVYAHAGRFLAAYDQSDGEGGPSAHVSVVDLVRRRTVSFMNLACCEGTPPLRLARDGTVAVIAPGDGVLVKAPGRRARALSGDGARDLAMFGGTVYWTEAGQARSATLPGVGGIEAVALEPVRLRRRGGACMRAKGRTITASGSIRVYETSFGRVACRVGLVGRLLLSGSTPPRIVADRWLLVYGEGSARVYDARTLRQVIAERPVGEATLLADGTLVWTGLTGGLFARTPNEEMVVLSELGGDKIAAARRAVYWTENGLPKVYRPRSPARSASKPG